MTFVKKKTDNPNPLRRFDNPDSESNRRLCPCPLRPLGDCTLLRRHSMARAECAGSVVVDNLSDLCVPVQVHVILDGAKGSRSVKWWSSREPGNSTYDC